MKPIKTVADLEQSIVNLADSLNLPVRRLRTTFIGVVTAQMLPDSVELKGGLAIKMKFGELGTRATSDLDAVYTRDYTQTVREIEHRCKQGWGRVSPSKKQLKADLDAPDRVGFTGVVKEKPQHDPGVRHPEYLMQPLRLTLNFLDKQWGGIDLELAHPETTQNLERQTAIDAELKHQFEQFGFGEITPVRFLAVEWQIAQKIHALTHPDSDRAHDLVDLQKLWTDEVDTHDLREACESIFRYRKEHPWPPLPLRPMEADRTRYEQAVEEVSVNEHHSDVRPHLEDAEVWLKTRLAHLLDDDDKMF